jgi:hypothetical protein
MDLGGNCDLLYISCQPRGENPVFRRTLARGEYSNGTLAGQPSADTQGRIVAH